MTVNVRITKNFKTAVKPLLKKYPSLSKDLIKLEAALRVNPTLGTPLGSNVSSWRGRLTDIYTLIRSQHDLQNVFRKAGVRNKYLQLYC